MLLINIFIQSKRFKRSVYVFLYFVLPHTGIGQKKKHHAKTKEIKQCEGSMLGEQEQ